MRRSAFLLAMAAALVLPSLALAGSGLPGTYSTKITAASAGQFKGTWTLKFAKAGAYTVSHGGAILITGKYTTSGAKVTLGHEKGPAACKPAATYTWKHSGTSLKFTKVKDSAAACSGRIMVLSRAFTQVG